MIGAQGVSMVDEFIMRKHGDIKVTYPHPSLEDTLKPTYGVMVYQEQVMATAMTVANYSLGEGDLLRRAMGKKIAEEMAKQRSRFLEGSRENEISDKIANEIFDTMKSSRAYGFQQVPLCGLRAHFLPYRLSEGPLSGGIHGRAHEYGNEQHRKDHHVRQRLPRHGHHGQAARTSTRARRASRYWTATSCSPWPPSRTWVKRPSTRSVVVREADGPVQEYFSTSASV